jgi:L-lactate dehydrogenase complex protein LldF
MTGNAFRESIRTSLANEALQAALDGNAERRTEGRESAFASLPDHNQRRQRAHVVRSDVIANLDVYLMRFITQVETNGIHVHRAADGAEAIKIFLEIASRHNAKLVAKSKSMVSEEINLNHALEGAGLRAVETDLGEYIVQLRGERPSHIITPAVHLRRHEVGALFHEKLGIPYTEDIPTLTNTARQVLREVFLSAEIGMSGVNFGVVETGTLCLVTNEGNGRMVTSIPPVHIALMGMERLLPNLDDLALFLSLLPRSATAQKLSVYTNLIHSPRRETDPEGPQERHLIVLDNGRSRLQASGLQEILMCIRCGACLNACPVFREIGGHGYVGLEGSIAPYPGPIGSVVSPGLFGAKEFGHLAQASSLCGACREACPVDIDLPGLLLRVRAGMAPSATNEPIQEAVGIPSPLKTGLKLFRQAAGRPGLFRFFQQAAGLGSRLLSPRSNWMRLPAATGWGYSKDLPRPALKPFRSRWADLQHEEPIEIARSKTKTKKIETEEDSTRDLAAQFIKELEALGGQCLPCSRAQLPQSLLSLLWARGLERILVDNSGYELLSDSGLELVRTADETCRAGLTRAVAGLADTGSLLVTGGPGELLAASLLPEIHIAILNLSDLQPGLEDVLNTPAVRNAPAAVVITGPSRTADIEMTLTIGVHGPGELIVLLVDDSVPTMIK